MAQAQYDREEEAGNLEQYAMYLTPDVEPVFDDMPTKNSPNYISSGAVYNVVEPLWANIYELTWYPDQDNALEFKDGQLLSQLFGDLMNNRVKIKIKKSGTNGYFDANILAKSSDTYIVQIIDASSDFEAHTWEVTSSNIVYSSHSVDAMLGAFAEGISGAMADVVIEQGTSGIWSYRKWSSGKAELWGTLRDAISIDYNAGSQVTKTLELPFALRSIMSFPSLRSCVDSIKYLNHVTTDGDLASNVQFHTEKAIPEGSEIRIDFYITGTTY